MGEWYTGLGWLVAVLFAAVRPRPADTQHARPPGPAPADRFTDGPPPRPPVRTGWPPGGPPPVRPDPGPVRLLVVDSP